MDWGYELAKEKFTDVTILKIEVYNKYDGKWPDGKIVINDKMADARKGYC